jgi:hypothetical protein
MNRLIRTFFPDDPVQANHIEFAWTHNYVKAVVDNIVAQHGPIHMADRNLGKGLIETR